MLFFHCMSAGHHSYSTRDSKQVGVFLSCVRDYRAFCTVQAVLQTATNRCAGSYYSGVVSSHKLVGCGNRGNSDAVVEWIPVAMFVQFAH